MINKIGFPQKIAYAQSLLQKCRRNYPYLSSTRTNLYPANSNSEVDKLHNIVAHKIWKERLRIVRAEEYDTTLSAFLTLSRNKSQMYGNCAEFAETAEAIANISAKKDCVCHSANMFQIVNGKPEVIDHRFLVIVDNKTSQNIDEFYSTPKYLRKNSLPTLHDRNSVVVDPWADIATSIHNAKELFKSTFSNVLGIDSSKKIYIVPKPKNSYSKSDKLSMKKSFSNLILNNKAVNNIEDADDVVQSLKSRLKSPLKYSELGQKDTVFSNIQIYKP